LDESYVKVKCEVVIVTVPPESLTLKLGTLDILRFTTAKDGLSSNFPSESYSIRIVLDVKIVNLALPLTTVALS